MFATQTNNRIRNYAFGMVGGMAMVQAVVVSQGHRITLRSQLAMGVVALGYLIFHKKYYLGLRRERFTLLTTHAIGYAVVNLSFWVHASYLWAVGQGAVINSDWYGVLFGMASVWGLGLAVHTWIDFRHNGFGDAVIA